MAVAKVCCFWVVKDISVPITDMHSTLQTTPPLSACSCAHTHQQLWGSVVPECVHEAQSIDQQSSCSKGPEQKELWLGSVIQCWRQRPIRQLFVSVIRLHIGGDVLAPMQLTPSLSCATTQLNILKHLHDISYHKSHSKENPSSSWEQDEWQGDLHRLLYWMGNCTSHNITCMHTR